MKFFEKQQGESIYGGIYFTSTFRQTLSFISWMTGLCALVLGYLSYSAQVLIDYPMIQSLGLSLVGISIVLWFVQDRMNVRWVSQHTDGEDSRKWEFVETLNFEKALKILGNRPMVCIHLTGGGTVLDIDETVTKQLQSILFHRSYGAIETDFSLLKFSDWSRTVKLGEVIDCLRQNNFRNLFELLPSNTRCLLVTRHRHPNVLDCEMQFCLITRTASGHTIENIAGTKKNEHECEPSDVWCAIPDDCLDGGLIQYEKLLHHILSNMRVETKTKGAKIMQAEVC